jgi:hypothetical protein
MLSTTLAEIVEVFSTFKKKKDQYPRPGWYEKFNKYSIPGLGW